MKVLRLPVRCELCGLRHFAVLNAAVNLCRWCTDALAEDAD